EQLQSSLAREAQRQKQQQATTRDEAKVGNEPQGHRPMHQALEDDAPQLQAKGRFGNVCPKNGWLQTIRLNVSVELPDAVREDRVAGKHDVAQVPIERGRKAAKAEQHRALQRMGPTLLPGRTCVDEE